LRYVDADGHCGPCIVVIVIAIAASAEYANAPTLNPNEPRYRAGTGQRDLVANILVSEMAGGAIKTVATPILKQLFPRFFGQEAVTAGQVIGQAEARMAANAANGAGFEKRVL
jgi:hypothetical protein